MADVDVVQGFRLSPQQERLWRQMGGEGAGACRALAVVQITGEPEPGALESALRRVCERYEILRTSFQRLSGMDLPLQVIADRGEPSLLRHDWSGREPRERQAEVDRLVRELQGMAPDPGNAPFREAVWVVLGRESHLLLLALPALVADRATLANLVQEIAASYGTGGAQAGPGEPPLQYADVSEWQHYLLESPETREGRRFWRERAPRGAVEVEVDLPFASSPVADLPFAPRSLALALPGTVESETAALASRLGATTFSTLALAAWQALLARLSQRTSLVVGVAFPGRRHEDLAGVLGPLVRHLPFRVEIEGSLSFVDLVARVAGTEQELEPWQEYFGGFPEGGEGEPAALFFPCCFERGKEKVAYDAAGLLFSLAHAEACSERFRLKLVSGGVGEDPPAELHYDASVISGADAERLSGWYGTLFREAVHRPERRVVDLGILTPAERQQVLVEANATAVSGSLQSLPDRFREQVRRSPDRIAVTDGERQLTFAGLDAAAERLARELRRRGVGPEIRVAVGTGRSIEMVLGILGTLKAGGGYVPLDPGSPPERLAFMLEDSGAAVLLVDEASRGRFPGATPPVVLLAAGRPGAAAGSPSPATAATALDALCYVIYTSGSTGRPKGVMVPHRGITNRLQWMARAFPLSTEDAVLQKTPYGFDASIWEIFSPLLTGARLVLAEPGGHQDASYLLDAVARFGVTVLQLVPSMLAVFVEQAGAGEGCRSLRRLFCGGEALPAALARRTAERLGVEVCNLYGPTETSIDATFEPAAGSLPGEGLAPLGRPLDNLRVYLLDRAGQPVPIGSPGELCVGGASLARGYLGRPELSAERFVPDGLGGSPGERLYRTGDLARWRPAGRLEFLGRIDRQVKIRGLRVEPEEIEAILCRHPLVRAAAVAPWGDTPADRFLAAYVVIEEGAPAPATEELSEFLAGALPEHMVPGVFTRLAALPRLASGKLDRSALPPPERAARAGASSFEPPASPVEELVAALWAELLVLPRVGRRDNFFALGGHSLLATELTSRVRELFQVEVRMRDLFEAPTVAGLAAAVEAGLAAGERPAAPPLVALLRDGDLPLSFAQQRLWFLDRLEPGSSAFNLTSALRLRGRLETAVLGSALDEIVQRHETLRTVFAERQGEPVQVVLARRPRPLSAVDLTGLPRPRRKPESARLLAAVAGQPFDLGQGPLARAALLRLERDEHVAIFVLHHIIADGWSMGVLVRELSALYGARVAGQPSPLPELPLQYADFARWQQRVLSGDRLACELAYWREHLTGLPPVLDLPLDRPRRDSPARRGAAERVSLPGDFAAGLESLARRERVTLFMLLLASFEVLLKRWSGQEDFAVGMPISGRDHLATEGLLGLFANTLVLRADLAGDPQLPILLDRVRAEVLEAFTHQDLPFEKLVQELAPRRSLAHSPLFQVMFGLQNERPAVPELPGIELSALAVPQSGAKYDLTLLLSGNASGLDGVLEYDPDRFDRTTILRLREQLEILLRGVMATPARRISELPLLAAAARAQVLTEWNDTPGGRPPEAGLATRVAAQAARTPDRVAMVAGTRTWTYGELVRRAALLALRLRERGVGPDVLVGVCLERSPEMVAALLGVVAAGGAYLPLDPDYPPSRLRSMLADSGVRWVLATAGLGEILPAEVERLEVETLWAGTRETAVGEEAETPLAALCYAIYTSGSTGRPKGVMVPHGGIANRLQWMARVFPLSAGDAVLQKTPYGFDASIWEIFSPLLAGARLVLAEPGGHQDASYLLDAVARFGVTVLQLVPSMLPVFVEQAGAAEGCRSLRRLFCGGEALPAALARRTAERLGAEVCNLYGPTETSIDATFEPRAGTLSGESLVPLGQPVDNLRVYLLDRAGQAVPVGSPGELCVGGASLARGYLGRPELTAERFVPDGLGGAPGERLYRTGDLARWRPAGRLEFLGRIDRQVKIRGLRVEPGEIEAILCLAPGVREAAVVAWPGPGGDLRLVAYVVPRDEQPWTEAVAAFLRSALPPQLLPTAFVPLPALPRTPNGKLDRGALPDPTGEQLHSRADFVAPRTPVEEALAEIWAELLGLDRVGVEDDFFALGGHSLLAARVAARVWEVLGVTLPVRDLFVAPRLADLAARIEERMLEAASAEQIEDLIAALEEMDPETVSEKELLRSLRR